ncbi:MAG: DUF642 domain-containing protein, partial [Pseudomonadota bacterium]|nr:DUF642 domain-containing protein [Pseudomonadota bacterium]
MVDRIDDNEAGPETEGETRATVTAAPATSESPAPPPGNILTNGTFELPTVEDDSFGIFQSIDGWTDASGGFLVLGAELTSYNVFASEGRNFLILDDDQGVDGVSQSVDTVAGQSYTLTFDARLTADDNPGSQGIEVVWNGDVVATVTPGSTAWEQISVTVTGTGGSDTLTLREPGDGTENDEYGALIDNVSLTSDNTGPVYNEIVGTDGINFLNGTNGQDSISALAGDDTIFG